MKILKTAIASLMCAIVIPVSAAEKPMLKVTDIKVSNTDDKLNLSVDINPDEINPGRDREIIFTPIIFATESNDSIEMPSIRISGHNRYWSHIRNNDLADTAKMYASGSQELIEYHSSVPYQSWMDRCHIDMRQEIGHCCNPVVVDQDIPLAEIDYVTPEIEPHLNFVALTGDELIERSAEGSAFIDFIVNRTEIKPTYRRNTVELAKIIESIDFVKNDPDAIITRVTIKGFASPEGSYSNNVRLAMGRTQSLKDYVREHYNFDPNIMSTDYEPEDWEGLRNRLINLDIAHRDEILDIVDSSLEPDPKNETIKRRYPSEYKFLLDSIYPALRHSDYTVKYRIKTYVDINELKRVFSENPANLRPVDFERIAATYSPDSPEFEAIYMKAVEIHPTDPAANINAANISLRHNDKESAERYLQHAGDSPEALYTRGALATANGDLTQALTLFNIASSRGLKAADEELDRINTEIKRQSVKYLIEPSTKK